MIAENHTATQSLTLSRESLQAFAEGRTWQVQSLLGAHSRMVEGQPMIRFSVWAPHAKAVSVVGDFNGWQQATDPLTPIGDSGIWCAVSAAATPGQRYKFAITGADGETTLRADPCGLLFEMRPANASVISDEDRPYRWQDHDWLAQRDRIDWQRAPLAIYEVHAGSWRRHFNGHWYTYRELAYALVPYVRSLGFTHIELMPLNEYPLDESWGYQSTGYFAPTSRYGSPDDLRFLVDYCHQSGLGVILDWVPGHFPTDRHALALFDGAPLYEQGDPVHQLHPQWGTLNFDYSRPQVRDFLVSSALHWLSDFHMDGLRVDAVASMLYLDFSRGPGQWHPNREGGNENLDAIVFLRTLNEQCQRRHPGALIIAEDSTDWSGVTYPVDDGGLGFQFKWNLGWMNDTLRYLALDPVYRSFHHNLLTFGLLYAFSEHFVLPLSHDEVVHEKASLVSKMPGDTWQKLANLRLLFLFMYGYPGAKLLFMGNEFAQTAEWNALDELDWQALRHGEGQGVRNLVRDLNDLYRRSPPLWPNDRTSHSFQWLDCHDNRHSVVSFVRQDATEHLVFVLNFTPVPRQNYRISMPSMARYAECLNTDSHHYGGSNLGNPLPLTPQPVPWMGLPQSVTLTLPPLGGVVLKPLRDHHPTDADENSADHL
ncbi:1,4-alpha-glucan branching protein GlgB [Marinobacter halodurans]|uniref:1,4-alpha-glucan branching enzyme GlgB n=1 Tax=Marinobacter halodurans TaxID=2528979 RepID=A0ABY1ZUF0_9GAMM|nr:1,4-alpha-glucan branching protein GlgB [Marinobacter halodurans]TBW59518.1 1,4-alpha-glucan branching protein GlgB [Marinobacter halodurans]